MKRYHACLISGCSEFESQESYHLHGTRKETLAVALAREEEAAFEAAIDEVL